ncbi:MAG: hypothetical protein Q8Q14_10150 [Gemmatimonadales bacterium]|nr:hypothetical protein [Gemmatimonadales bacterium]
MKLKVRYQGREPDRGRMSATELGPAILGIGEMVGQASRILFGDQARVRVEVQAEPQHASFGIEFFAVAPGAGLVPPLSLQDLAAIAAILGFGGGTAVATARGLVWLVRWLRGRKIDKVEKVGDDIRITINDQSTNITVNEYRVFVNPQVRKGLKAVVAPLEQEGFDSVSIEPETQPPQVIEKSEREFFARIPLPEEEISVDRSTAILEVVAPAFREGYKWRFAQGGETFFAAILDEKFLGEVAQHQELFGSGDALKVEMEIRTTRTEDGFDFERRIVHVVEHIRSEGRGGQLPLV